MRNLIGEPASFSFVPLSGGAVQVPQKNRCGADYHASCFRQGRLKDLWRGEGGDACSDVSSKALSELFQPAASAARSASSNTTPVISEISAMGF